MKWPEVALLKSAATSLGRLVREAINIVFWQILADYPNLVWVFGQGLLENSFLLAAKTASEIAEIDDIDRGFISSLSYAVLVLGQYIRLLLREIMTFGKYFRQLKATTGDKRKGLSLEDKEAIENLYFANTSIVLDSLEHLEGVYDGTLIDYLQDARLREAEILNSETFVERVITRARPNNIKEMLRGYQLEREAVLKYEIDKQITPRHAKQLRQNINQLEDYSLKEKANTLPYDVVDLRRQTGK